MFERYSESARRTLFFARYEASQLGSVSIEPEHVLLGILRESKSVAVGILADAGVKIAALRAELEAATTFCEKISTSVEIPFSPACKHVLQFSTQEADALGHHQIGPEHLLLGILREEKSAAAQLLTSRGIGLTAVRDRLSAGSAEKTTLIQRVEAPGVDHAVDADELKRRINEIRVAARLIQGQTAEDLSRELAASIRDALDDLERFLLGPR